MVVPPGGLPLGVWRRGTNIRGREKGGESPPPDSAASCSRSDETLSPGAESRIRGVTLLAERVLEAPSGAREVDLADEGRGLSGAVLAVHAGIFPLDGKRTLVANVV